MTQACTALANISNRATDRLANKFHDAEEQRESWQRRVDLAGSSFRADIDAHLQQVRGSTTYI